MHPAPSLAEAPPKADGQQRPTSPGSVVQGPQTPSASPPIRKGTISSTSTSATAASAVTLASNEIVGTTYSLDASSPSFAAQAIFSVKDGADISDNRRATRRRTGPLSAEQREKAALIRKLGACTDCRRRRVAVSTDSAPLSFWVLPYTGSWVQVPSEPSQHDMGGCHEEIQVA